MTHPWKTGFAILAGSGAVLFFSQFNFAASPGNAPKPEAAPANTATAAAPVIRGLKLEPSSLTLEDGRDARRVLVWGEIDAKTKIDLTAQAVLKPESGVVAVEEEGFIQPKQKGATTVTISAAGKQIKLPVTVLSAEMPPVRFVRDIEPVLSKAGCNAGTCHGSANGKNGFKLSLRGYD